MNDARTLIYDGSFNGFLTAVHEAFERKISVADIEPNDRAQASLFTVTEIIFTQVRKAQQVWEVLQRRNYHAMAHAYFAFLGGAPQMEMPLYTYIVKVLKAGTHGRLDHSDTTVQAVEQWARQVGNEKQRAEATIRFKKSGDGVFCAALSPTSDLLPLLTKHFRKRMKHLPWLLFDEKRKYGMYCNGSTVEKVALALDDVYRPLEYVQNPISGPSTKKHPWDDFFGNTEIIPRIKGKVHGTSLAPKTEPLSQ
ncbi:MAG: TIGR03915 family putative DNA repair protein, partial [Flavobacteriaceae bacterium]